MNEINDIVKSGAADKMADLIHKLAGPMSEEFGLMLGDKVRAYRAKNLASVMQKTQCMLTDARVSPNAVPPRLLLPIMEASSVEDADVLQGLWAGLLATASQETDGVSPSFIETLKQLTPYDAQHFESIVKESLGEAKRDTVEEGMDLVLWAFGVRHWHYRAPKDFAVPPGVDSDTYERLGLIGRKYVAGSQFDRSDLKVETELDYWYVFTSYGVRFLRACHGPYVRMD